ncbi:MAG: glycosyltransferase [Deltaproteobacteria bacterium]|nr:glycosyltransferase [Deltaproteobacteria bacterium]
MTPLSERPTVDVVIPALDEEEALGAVIAAIPDTARRVIVADNGSTDRTAEVAANAGAEVIREPERGYGAACLAALAHLAADPPDVVVFLDGDGSDDPSELDLLLDPLRSGAALVIGSRTRGDSERGSLTAPQRVGNALACRWIHWVYGERFSDLGPFRAIRWEALEALQMRDRNWGWTVEMQLAAARRGIPCAEVAVRYRNRRGGRSKVSGTIRGSVSAGAKILWLLTRETLRPRTAS